MRYKIRLTIDYDYQQPSDHARNLLHLLPPDIAGVQTVTARRLTIDPAPEERADRLDFFGNTMTMIARPRSPANPFSERIGRSK